MLSANSRHSFQQPAVLGSGDSGIQIAALLANAGLRVKLYDVAGQEQQPSPAEAALERLFQLDPSPLSGVEASSLITPCDFKQHVQQLNEHDLIIEAYDLPQSVKQIWLTRLAPHFSRSALIVSLTQGEPVSALGAVLPAGMRSHFLGARFSAFPRLQRLVELIPTARSEERLVQDFARFLQDSVGVKPRIIEDHANFLFLRLWLFFLCTAFAHGKNLSSIQREAATALVFEHQGGIHFFLQQIGLANSRHAYERLDYEDIRRFAPLLDWQEILDKPLALFSSRVLTKAIPEDLQQLWAARDWQGLRSHPHPCADFICRYLRDCWQFLAYISETLSLSGKDLDSLLYDGLGWGLMPWQLLQDFEPKKVYESTLSEQAQLNYPVSAHWRRRARHHAQRVYQGDEFTHAAKLIQESPHSRQYLYREDLLIWQPQAEIVDLDSKTLQELQAAVTHARREHHALMIYHHGSQLGVMRNWLQAGQYHELEHNLALLIDCIIALRMHPRFVIFSGGGTLLDAGIALMLQADRVITEADLTWQLTTFPQGLTGIGGIWFEWLRRLPRLSSELSRLQIATVLEKLLHDGGIHSLHGARDMGLLRSHDRYVMNRSQLAYMSRKMADVWIESDSRRAMRYPLYKPNAEDLEWHLLRSESSPDPERYRELIALLAAEHQQQVLSLRHFLHSENELFFRYLNDKIHD